MADENPALVLHLVSGGEPLLFPLRPDDVDEFAQRLHLHLEHGSVEKLQTKDGLAVNINFAHVAAAYIDNLNRQGKVFGMR